MRDYARDLQARLAAPPDPGLFPEHLAFAEGRLLTIHPFQDFNGRLVRLWLWEILRRLGLPPVELAPAQSAGAPSYLAALREYDAGSIQPLISVWQDRLTHTE